MRPSPGRQSQAPWRPSPRSRRNSAETGLCNSLRPKESRAASVAALSLCAACVSGGRDSAGTEAPGRLRSRDLAAP
jgi:hypothetical protein